jgi:hypothetical protein
MRVHFDFFNSDSSSIWDTQTWALRKLLRIRAQLVAFSRSPILRKQSTSIAKWFGQNNFTTQSLSVSTELKKALADKAGSVAIMLKSNACACVSRSRRFSTAKD